MNLSLAYSPCPNDTFIFYALSHAKINLNNLEFTTQLADVEMLNQMAQENGPDITKLSFHAWAHVSKNYQLLTTGGAIGKGNGPLLVSRQEIQPSEISDARIAIPGYSTTAFLLLKLLYPNLHNTCEYLFSDIPEAVVSGEADLGLIIHESRFLYKKMGLHLVADLGKWWESKTRLPIPLGGIAIQRNLPPHIKLQVNKLIRDSIIYAQNLPQTVWPYICQNAKELDESVIRKHIKMFVNNYSVTIGNDGRRAVMTLYKKALALENFPAITKPVFIDEIK